MPPGAIYVGRPTIFGNPFPITGRWAIWAALTVGCKADTAGRREAAVKHYRRWLEKQDRPHHEIMKLGLTDDMSGPELGRIEVPRPPTIARIRAELAGKDLVCWCPLDRSCHADVLLEIANAQD